jgi:hypothetical protein
MGDHGNATFNALVNIEHLGRPGTLWNSGNPPRLRAPLRCPRVLAPGKEQRPMKCLLCEDCGWVCENHPDQALTVPQLYQDMCKRRTQAGQ